jgi:hypothetical protein
MAAAAATAAAATLWGQAAALYKAALRVSGEHVPALAGLAGLLSVSPPVAGPAAARARARAAAPAPAAAGEVGAEEPVVCPLASLEESMAAVEAMAEEAMVATAVRTMAAAARARVVAARAAGARARAAGARAMAAAAKASVRAMAAAAAMAAVVGAIEGRGNSRRSQCTGCKHRTRMINLSPTGNRNSKPQTEEVRFEDRTCMHHRQLC